MKLQENLQLICLCRLFLLEGNKTSYISNLLMIDTEYINYQNIDEWKM